MGISERRACAVAGQHRSTQRKRPRGRDDEEALTAAIIRLASQYGRYGYRRITALLRTEGWHVNAKRVQRIWRREGLKVPQKQPKRGRLWLNDGSCIRLRPCWPNHVWSYDFVMDRTHDGRKFRMLTVIDEFTRRCMAVVVERRLNSDNVLHCLTELFVQHGPPDHIRSDNGSEFTAHAVRDWLGRIGVKTLVNGGGIMLHARRPGGPVAAAQKLCHSWSPCRLRRGAGDVRRGALCGGSTGGCRRGSEPSRGGPAVRHRPPDGEEDAELFGAAGIPPDEAGQAAEAGRVHRHRRRDPGGGHGSGRAAQAASTRRIGSSSGYGTSTGSPAATPS